MCAGPSQQDRHSRKDVDTGRTVEKQGTGLIVGCDALQQRKRIAYPVGSRSCKLGGIEKGINGDDLLNEGSHDT